MVNRDTVIFTFFDLYPKLVWGCPKLISGISGGYLWVPVKGKLGQI